MERRDQLVSSNLHIRMSNKKADIQVFKRGNPQNVLLVRFALSLPFGAFSF
jgi:hypothetical protein